MTGYTRASMLRPVVGLVAARARRRGATTALSIAAIAMATALVAIVAGIGLVASDATLARALATTGRDRPVVRVSDLSPSGRDAAATKSTAAGILDDLDPYTTSVIRGVLFHQLVDLETPVVDLIAGVDDPERWLQLSEGRMPAPCVDATHCEAVLLAEEAPAGLDFDTAIPTAGVELQIVGRGQLDPGVPFGDLDPRGPGGAQGP